MSKIKSISIILLDNALLLLLCAILLLPLLPLNLVYKQTISTIFVISSVSLFLLCLRELLQTSEKIASLTVLGLLLLYLLYLVLQITPVPSSLLSYFSSERVGIWQSNAYGLSGFSALSLDISTTIWFAILWLGYLSIFLLTSMLITDQKRLLLITFVVFMLGLYQVSFDIVSKSTGYYYVSASEIDGHSYRLTGTFINSNNLSALLNLSFAAGLALLVMMFNRYKLSKNLGYLFLIICVVSGLLILLYGSIQSGSVGGFLALTIAVGLVGFIVLCRRFNLRNLLLLAGFFTGIFFLLIFYGSREINVEQLTGKLTLSGRPALWGAVLDMWQKFLIFGVGGGAFEWVFPAFKTDVLSPLRVINAHSSYLNMLAETGVTGVIILLMILMVYVQNVIRLLKKYPGLVYLAGSFLIGWLAFIIHEAVENSFLLPSVTGPFFCLMALVLCLNKIEFIKDKKI